METVAMTDIVERLRNEGLLLGSPKEINALVREAADNIERLRERIAEDENRQAEKLSAEIERLQASEKAYADLYMDRCAKWADLRGEIARLRVHGAKDIKYLLDGQDALRTSIAELEWQLEASQSALEMKERDQEKNASFEALGPGFRVIALFAREDKP